MPSLPDFPYEAMKLSVAIAQEMRERGVKLFPLLMVVT
jgi:hypothetical protein